MKINFTQLIKGLDGNPVPEARVVDGREVLGEPIKLSAPCINSLLANDPNERVDGVEKLIRFALAQRIQQSTGEIEVKAEEIAKIKELVGKFMPTLIAGSVWKILEDK